MLEQLMESHTEGVRDDKGPGPGNVDTPTKAGELLRCTISKKYSDVVRKRNVCVTLATCVSTTHRSLRPSIGTWAKKWNQSQHWGGRRKFVKSIRIIPLSCRQGRRT